MLVYCLYDPFTMDDDFIHGLLGSFPLLRIEDSSYNAPIVMYFSYWTSLVLGYDDIGIFKLTIFEDIHYVLRFGGFIVDTLIYYDLFTVAYVGL